jgi:pimeloyl-ACP methyl ester carboxylesterase
MPQPQLRSGSKFTEFALKLSNGAKLTGLQYAPSSVHEQALSKGRPLLVLIHGGTCTPYHFDLTDDHTYSNVADALNIPIVAIDRPGYGGTTTFLPLNDAEDDGGRLLYHLETARWLHEHIFPALWQEFGIKTGCTGLVGLGHSMAGEQVVIVGGLYSRDQAPAYPLKGIVIYGMGCRMVDRPELREGFEPDQPFPNQIFFQDHAIERLMLSESSLELCEDNIYPNVTKMVVGMPVEELLAHVIWWLPNFRQYAGEINVPVLYQLGAFDWLWETSEEHVKEFGQAFIQCPRFDGALVADAPHAIEWSQVGKSWSMKVGEWAVAVA